MQFKTQSKITMESYDNNEEKSVSNASEPQIAYGNTQPVMPVHSVISDNIPKGYLSLEQFGELFHKKLDDCYAHLPSNN